MSELRALVACRYCDLLQREVPLSPGSAACCGRCGALLYRRPRSDSIEHTLAFAVTAAVLLAIANAFPIMALEIQGQRQASTLIGAVHALWVQGARPVAVLVLLTTVIFPAVETAMLIYCLAPLRVGRATPGTPALLRLLQAIRPWGMVEVYVLGVLVSLVKLTHLATVHPGTALWATAALMLALAGAATTFDARAVWERLGDSR